MKTYAFGIGISVLLVAVIVLGLRDRAHNDAQIADLRGRLADVAAAGVESRGECPASIGMLPTYRIQAPLPATSAPAAARPSAVAPNAEVKPPVMEPPEIRDNLEMAFVSDHGAPNWGTSSRSAMKNKLESALPSGSELRSVDCHESICRIESSHTAMRNYNHFLHDAFMSPKTQLWNGGFYSTRLNDGDPPGAPLLFVTYLAQEGKDLPFH